MSRSCPLFGAAQRLIREDFLSLDFAPKGGSKLYPSRDEWKNCTCRSDLVDISTTSNTPVNFARACVESGMAALKNVTGELMAEVFLYSRCFARICSPSHMFLLLKASTPDYKIKEGGFFVIHPWQAVVSLDTHVAQTRQVAVPLSISVLKQSLREWQHINLPTNIVNCFSPLVGRPRMQVSNGPGRDSSMGATCSMKCAPSSRQSARV